MHGKESHLYLKKLQINWISCSQTKAIVPFPVPGYVTLTKLVIQDDLGMKMIGLRSCSGSHTKQQQDKLEH